MAEVVDWTPEELGALHTNADLSVPKVPTILSERQDDPGFIDTVVASFKRENYTTEAFRETNLALDNDGAMVDIAEDWNPYTYIRENWDEDKQKEYDLFIRQGLFENTWNSTQVELKAQNISRERKLLDTISRGSAPGAIVGGVLGALLDPLSFVPGTGAFVKMKSLSTVSRYALAAAVGATPQELALRTEQDFRTKMESFLNIGTAGVIGGGIGGLARAFNKGHPLNPFNPGNPLRVENFDNTPVGVRVPGGGEDIIAPKSVGAAANEAVDIKALKGIMANIPGLKWVGEKVTGATPVGRALQYSGAKTKQILTSMMNMGGVLTNTNRFGERLGIAGHSAEDIMDDLLYLRENLFVRGEKYIRDLNIELGQSSVPTFFGRRGRVAEGDFAAITRRKVLNDWTDADTNALVAKYGEENARKIEAKAQVWAEDVHNTNAEFERELIDIGRLRDPGKVTKLASDLRVAQDALKEARDRAANPEVMARGDVDDTAELALTVDNLKKAYNEEIRKPEPMGRDYGHAQLWDSHTILAKQEDFEDFLLEVFKDHPDEQWLFDNYGMAKAEFDDLVNQEYGPAKRKEILREWAGDEFTYRQRQAELRVKSAQQALDDSQADLLYIFRQLGLINRNARRVSISQARKERDAFNARLNAQRVKLEQLKAEQRALREAGTAARERTLERQQAHLPDVSAERIAASEARLAKREDDLLDTLTTPDEASAGRLENSGEYVKRTKAVSDAEQSLNDLRSYSPEPEATNARVMAEERARTVADEMRRVDTRVAKMEKQLKLADERLKAVEDKAEFLRKEKEAGEELLDEARKAGRKAEKEAGKAARAAKGAARRTPLDQVVEELKLALINRNVVPSSIMEHIVPETGRVRARRINLTAEQRRIAEQAGFLRTDLTHILHAQYQDLAGYIGLHKGLDIGAGRTFESWAAVEDSVNREYADLAAKAGPEGASAVGKERDKALKDVRLLKDRLLGMENVGADRDGWVYWLSQKARQANLVRFMAGFLVSSLTDIGTVHLRTGGLARLLQRHGREAARLLVSLHSENPSEFLALINATEIGVSVRMSRITDTEDAMVSFGIGPTGSFKHKVTGSIDRAGRWLSERGNVLSGMYAWNRYWKIAAGLFRADNLRTSVGRYAELSDLEKADLASLGIDEAAAKRIHSMMEKYGRTDERGHFDPNLDDWKATAQGREAARDFRIAIEKDMNQAVMTPGLGDTPALMSHTAGKLWLQFQSFAFTFLNRFMIPASQRIATMKDAQAIMSFVHLAWSGLVVVLAKDIVRGQDPMKRFEEGKWGETAFDILDRTGVMTYMSPYVDSLIKLSGPAQEAAFGEVKVGPTSRFARNRYLDSALGANYGGLRNDIEQFGSAVAEGDMEKIAKKGILLAPYNTYLRLGQQLHAVLGE